MCTVGRNPEPRRGSGLIRTEPRYSSTATTGPPLPDVSSCYFFVFRHGTHVLWHVYVDVQIRPGLIPHGTKIAHIQILLPFLVPSAAYTGLSPFPPPFSRMEPPSDTTQPPARGTSAPYGKACVTCSKAKCRCVYGVYGLGCER